MPILRYYADPKGWLSATMTTSPHHLRRARTLLWRGLPVLGTVVAILIWQAATSLFQVQLRGNARYLFHEALVTVLEAVAGAAVGAAAGLLTAGVIAVSPGVERTARPLAFWLRTVLKLAPALLLTVSFGLWYAPNVALAALSCFPPVLIATIVGLTSTPAELDDLTRLWAASRWQILVRIRVPWAMPRILTGLKLGTPLAPIGTVLAQLIWHRQGPDGGLGAVIVRSGSDNDGSLALAAITLLAAVSVALSVALFAAERLLPWTGSAAARPGRLRGSATDRAPLH